MKRHLFFTLSFMIITSNLNASDYLSNFGELMNVYPYKYNHFISEDEALLHIKSFGYIGNHLKLVNTIHSNYYGGEETNVYAIAQDDLKFKGTLLSQGCGIAGNEPCNEPAPDYCKQFYSDKISCSQKLISATDWQFYFLRNNPSFKTIDRTADAYWKNVYTYEVTYTDSKKNITEKATYSATLIRQDKWNCTPPDGDKFTNVFQNGALDSSLLNQYGNCAYNSRDATGQELKVYITRMLGQIDTDYPSCEIGFDGDPVDMQSGKLYENVTDYTFKFPLPIIISRVYSGNTWTHSYTRYLNIGNSGNNITLYFDDGSKQSFTKLDNQFITITKNGSKLAMTNDVYQYTYPSGAKDNFDQYGKLISHQANNGLKLNFQYDANTMIISDEFSHEINIHLTKNLISVIEINSKYSIHYNYDEFGNLIEVVYPNNTKVNYQYIKKSDGYYLQSASSGGSTFAQWDYYKSGAVSSNNRIR